LTGAEQAAFGSLYQYDHSVIRFGRYDGCTISDLPDWYLGWLSAQSWLRSNYRRPVESEIRRRLAVAASRSAVKSADSGIGI
jgi:hypothetical protein